MEILLRNMYAVKQALLSPRLCQIGSTPSANHSILKCKPKSLNRPHQIRSSVVGYIKGSSVLQVQIFHGGTALETADKYSSRSIFVLAQDLNLKPDIPCFQSSLRPSLVVAIRTSIPAMTRKGSSSLPQRNGWTVQNPQAIDQPALRFEVRPSKSTWI